MEQFNFHQIILTGFKTFGSHSKNPTEELISSLTEQEMKQRRIAKKFALDVTCTEVDCFAGQLKQEFDELKPGKKVLIVHMGVGPNKVYFLEECAYNNKDFSIPDNSGYQPCKEQICKATELDCPLKTGLNLKQLADTLKVQICPIAGT